MERAEKVADLVERLRAVKECEEEPSRCSDNSGPYCDRHHASYLYTGLLREAADMLEELVGAADAPAAQAGVP